MAVSTPPRTPPRAHRRIRPPSGLLGGARGNEVLTRATAAVLVALLAVEGVTVVSIEGLVRVHMFVGLILIPPLLLKVGATGYRFARYYMGTPAYREKGPPAPLLRVTAPVLVVATAALFATGVWLMAIGHSSDGVKSVHSLSAIVFVGAFAIHFLAHAPTVLRSLRADWSAMLRQSLAGAGPRAMLLAASLGGGVALALSMLGLITGWHGE